MDEIHAPPASSAPTGETRRATNGVSPVEGSLVPAATEYGDRGQDSPWTEGVGNRSWRHELPRWLATLNPGRTQREYEKAVSYFFDTPGVPQTLSELSFDLLLAYRGALALRATAHQDVQPLRRSPSQADQSRLSAGKVRQIEGDIGDDSSTYPAADVDDQPVRPTPLSPATVNVRLTALRQFLVTCHLFGSLTHLTPDQIRTALKRLQVERRRPYQVLAEPEWEQFLAAAWAPQRDQHAPASTATTASTGGDPDSRATASQVANTRGTAASARRIRTRAGLTGERTARRDHALLSLALATGLRSIELASLDVGDLVREWHAGQEEWWLVLPDAKTKGQHGGRVLPLTPSLVTSLVDYIESTGRHWERSADRGTPLFLSGAASWEMKPPIDAHDGERRQGRRSTARRDRRLSVNHIRDIVDRVETQWTAEQGADEAGDTGRVGTGGGERIISPHSLRHSTAIALLEGNSQSGRPPASVEHVRGWLGHLDIRTTQGYLSHLEARKHRRPFALNPEPEGALRPRIDADDAQLSVVSPPASPTSSEWSGAAREVENEQE